METAQAAPPQGMKDVSKGHVLPSGATLHVNRPAFAAAGQLRNAVARALSATPISAEEMKTTFDDLKGDPSKGGALLQRILGLASSEAVEEAIFECLKPSAYQPKGSAARVKVDRALFDDETFGDGAREDYYAICFRAAEVAIKPFLAPLASSFAGFQAKLAAARGSTSASPAKGS